jgi:hypothetical protein
MLKEGERADSLDDTIPEMLRPDDLQEFCSHLAECQWLMPVILATWEAEVSRIVVEASPGK